MHNNQQDKSVKWNTLQQQQQQQNNSNLQRHINRYFHNSVATQTVGRQKMNKHMLFIYFSRKSGANLVFSIREQ